MPTSTEPKPTSSCSSESRQKTSNTLIWPVTTLWTFGTVDMLSGTCVCSDAGEQQELLSDSALLPLGGVTDTSTLK